MNNARYRHPSVGAGLTPRALAPPTAHSSQGVAGAAPPATMLFPPWQALRQRAPTTLCNQPRSSSIPPPRQRAAGAAAPTKKQATSHQPPLPFAKSADGQRRHTQVPPYARRAFPVGRDLCVPPTRQQRSPTSFQTAVGNDSPRRGGRPCPPHPGTAHHPGRAHGTRPRHPSVGRDLCVPPKSTDHRQTRMNNARYRHPSVGAGLTPRALAPPTAHSSQGVAGSAPPETRRQ
jgi:hypothetical protein